jgi:light-regulated signal transduction histidine kinase (bacteriophytochrome)
MTEKEFNKLFAYLISHEFKTPLTSIFGFAQMLQKRYDPSWNQEIIRQAIRMNLILDQGVVFNRLYHDNLEFRVQEIDIRSALEASIHKFKLAYPDAEVLIEGQSSKISGDDGKLQNVFLDLLFLSIQKVKNNKMTIVIDDKKIMLPVDLGEIPELESIKNSEQVGLWVDNELLKKYGMKLAFSR